MQESHDPFSRVWDTIQEHLPLILGGAICLASGAILLFDDVKDFGDFATPEHPSPIHHWQWGVILIILGAVVLAIALILLIVKLLTG